MFSLITRIFPENTTIPFMKWRNIAFAISAVLMIASVVAIVTRGLNFGIDFEGGTLVEIATPEAIDIGRVRSVVGGLGLGEVQVQEFGDPTTALIRVQTQTDETDPEGAQQRARNAVETAIRDTFEGVEIRRVEVVGPKVSGDLVNAGLLALGLSVAAMLAYIWVRFEWRFGVAAVIALVHDVTITIGIFALLQLEFTLAIVAAALTIVGYSINDTVVVFDRIREKMRKYKKMPMVELFDFALNKTLSRTIMTSFTTLIAVLALYVLGGEVLRGFSFAILFGVAIGTYSSIFVAAPLLLLTGVRREALLDEDARGDGDSAPALPAKT